MSHQNIPSGPSTDGAKLQPWRLARKSGKCQKCGCAVMNKSRTCRACRKNRIALVCPQCETTFELTPSLVRQSRRHFCGKPCQAAWQRTHVNPNWLQSGQRAMKAKWDAMAPAERLASSNIKALLAAAKTPRVRRILADSKRGDMNPMKRSEVAQKVSTTIKRKWRAFFSEQMSQNWKDGKIPPPWQTGPTKLSPNGMEQVLAAILADVAPTFRFTGNRAFWVGPSPSGRRRNPDFVDSKTKRAILLHGEYWHTTEDAAVEVSDYLSCKWQVLVIWTRELQQKNRAALLLRIVQFLTSASSASVSLGRLTFTT
jgi:G:T-mismatch repair DNA endonuclease (very short patch repair protein)